MGNKKVVAAVRVTVETDHMGDWYNVEVFDSDGHSFAAVGSSLVETAMQHATSYVSELTAYGVKE